MFGDVGEIVEVIEYFEYLCCIVEGWVVYWYVVYL